MPRGRCWSDGSSSNGRRRDRDHHRDLLPSDGGRSSQSWFTRSSDSDPPATWRLIGRRGGVVEELHDRCSIEPRLGNIRGGIAAIRGEGNRRTTRTTIVARSWRDRGPIAARSWPDRGPIVARSRPDRGPIVGLLRRKSRLIWREIEAIIAINGSNRLLDRLWPSIRLHDRVNRPPSLGQISL